jgi:mannose-6-phosphate isomerase-like protein (cupin superfamily)
MSESEEPAITDRVGTRLLFENDRVRVWDLALAPGEWLEGHRHRDDFLFIVAQGGHLRHADPNSPADGHEVRYADGQVVFIEAHGDTVHQRLTNIGDAPYRNFVIELKSGKD